MRVLRLSVFRLTLLLLLSVVVFSTGIFFALVTDFSLISFGAKTVKIAAYGSGRVSEDHIEIRKKPDVFAGGVGDATIFTICRNSDLDGISNSIKSLEARFNNKYHYPWVFANDEPFTSEFKDKIESLVSGDVHFTTIPKEYWEVPSNIDSVLLNNRLEYMEKEEILYGGNLSYRKMCRFNSGFFYKLKALEKFNWYWRVEPNVKYHCDLTEDYFKVMVDEGKIYGFSLAMLEDKRTIRNLWNTSRKYFENISRLQDNIQDGEVYAPENDVGSLGFIEHNADTDELVRGEYNLCHYWTNFEIASLNFFRGPEYNNFFKKLDETGNFFYERWGDAPVHSIAVSYLLNKDQIKYFDNTGYYHETIGNCPRRRNVFKQLHCSCSRYHDFSWKNWSCVPRWFKGLGLEPPQNEHF